ncbi:NAD(P)/FAD-dependent oxidoreductase [Lutimonas zeaxanthinifaciens]|uniref:NAD(P)/FAD-dependent oxidoreductase n=1 Tax=Lutimonas zeaxanthinifaciens TaxID=3060215 RepID=UPI00265CD90B|nr:NAD(P)/FAD-dependent oxidoreductase [Lutimonas sp. YSD2104]WKK66236.1 NAD(P)/FAD-dependent oxidoreductase [Lutimonas sp. YSD2104]
MDQKDVLIIGGGAAGFFAAINIAESNSGLNVTILEKSSKVLQKVKVSGGGRCNVTHACFDPKELVSYYPRGEKELLGPFHTFMTGDTIEWFETRGIELKVEDDMRIFPVSNNSQTIIDCFLNSAEKAGIEVLLNQNVNQIKITENGFEVATKTDQFRAENLLITAGGNSKMWELIKKLDHTIVDPVPSLFTFNIKDPLLKNIPGISVPDARISIKGLKRNAHGPVLITHWGLSGPAVLKLSSLAALELAASNYDFRISLNWINSSKDETDEKLRLFKTENPKKKIGLRSPYPEIPRRFWENMLAKASIDPHQNWSDLSKIRLESLSEILTDSTLSVKGKTTFKEEFVTAGGVDLKEINFKRFESRIHPNLYFAGEVLNIDGLTGGFNFQNAWTGGFIAARAISSI